MGAMPRPLCLVIVNPAAGGGRTERLWRDLRDDLRRLGLVFEWAPTTGPGSATDLARAAADRGLGLVVAVGGDGTLNEVVNGAVADDRPRPSVGAILTGRGRDAARNFGLAADPRAAARRLVEGADVSVDLVRAEWPGGVQRWVVSAAGAGFDAAVAVRAASRRGRGTLPYLLSIVATLSAHATVAAEIDADGERAWSGRLSAAVVANGAHYGGGMKIAPAADPSDGRLDLVVLGDLGRLELLRWLPTVYRGRHLANPKVRARAARRVTIRPASPLPVHVDGEIAPATPVTFTVRPGALRLRR
ncbi:MAG: diacylglycerol kinase [Candidatus Rokuibacteriota bacterium]|nr:MAG: diacylglycerol kinase [Candidatus Rokubacteria bacterium]